VNRGDKRPASGFRQGDPRLGGHPVVGVENVGLPAVKHGKSGAGLSLVEPAHPARKITAVVARLHPHDPHAVHRLIGGRILVRLGKNRDFVAVGDERL
jgi:hypothetical protein